MMINHRLNDTVTKLQQQYDLIWLQGHWASREPLLPAHHTPHTNLAMASNLIAMANLQQALDRDKSNTGPPP